MFARGIKKGITIAVISAIIFLFGASPAAGETLAPCPPQDVMVDLSLVSPLFSWTKLHKGLVSDYFGGSSDALQLAFKEATVEWSPDSCPYSIGWFHGLTIPIGFFDSDNALWRLPKEGE